MAKLSVFRSQQITQGTVVDNVQWGEIPEPLSIVLSNACDFENDKLGYVILAALVSANDVIVSSKEFTNKVEGISGHAITSVKAKKSIITLLENYIYNKSVQRYYFLNTNEVLDCPPLLVDFQRIQSIPYENLANLEALAQLESPYKEQMMVQFASYTARIPVNREEYSNELANELIKPYSINV